MKPAAAPTIVAALLVLSALPAAAQSIEVAVDGLNVRASPWGTVIDRAGRGLQLAVRGERDGFVAVDWGDRQGWVHASYVRRTAAPVVEVTATALNVRVLPSTSDTVIATARRGQRFVQLGRSGDWLRVQFGARTAWVHGDYTQALAAPAPGPAPAPAPGPTTPASGWQALHRGLTLDGAEVPRAGLRNDTLRRALGVAVEPYGDTVTHGGRSFVRGTVSWFGGRNDTGVTATETGSITGELLRALEGGASGASAADRARNPEDYYYCAMRWDYAPQGRTWWKNARVLIVSPSTGKAVVVRPVDWGPHTRTRRIIDLSPQALRDLGIRTDDVALVSFAAPDAPLGPVR